MSSTWTAGSGGTGPRRWPVAEQGAIAELGRRHCFVPRSYIVPSFSSSPLSMNDSRAGLAAASGRNALRHRCSGLLDLRAAVMRLQMIEADVGSRLINPRHRRDRRHRRERSRCD